MSTAQMQPLAIRPRDAAAMLSVSERTLASWTAAGRIRCVRVGNGGKGSPKLYRVAELERFLRAGGAVVEPQPVA